MANEISGFGAIVTLAASITFPVGFQITQFADDSDPVDLPVIQIAECTMGLNGDLISWANAAIIPVVISVIPGSDDDINLSILSQANRVAQGKISVFDSMVLTLAYPDGKIIVFSGGKLTNAPFGNSIASSGRQKSKTYSFAFQGVVGL